MKKTTLLFAIVALTALFISVASASAATINTYTYKNSRSYYVNNELGYPTDDQYFKLYFPKSTEVGGVYTGGVFEFDNYYPGNINKFNITLTGHGDNSTNPISIWISFTDDAGHADRKQIASYDVQGTASFTLSMNLLTNRLLYSYNGGAVQDVGALTNLSMADFLGKDSFNIGYACHFNHDSTGVEVSVPQAVPEPTTLLLLGAGLSGIALIMGRKRS